MSQAPRVAVMRERVAAFKTAERLLAKGYDPVLAPVADIVPTGAEPEDRRFGLVIATSAHTVRGLSEAALARLRTIEAYVVGGETDRAFAAAGHMARRRVFADAAALGEALVARRGAAAEFLYLAALHRNSTIEQVLAASSAKLSVVVVYEAKARSLWSQKEAQAVAACTFALHYSQRSAEVALELAAKAKIEPSFLALTHVCLSAAVAEPLQKAGARTVLTAASPDEPGLLERLAEAAAGLKLT